MTPRGAKSHVREDRPEDERNRSRAGRKGSRASLTSLKPLLPFALRYKPRIAAAIVALAGAAASTLILPVAARRVIDQGFSGAGSHFIDAYFGVLVAIVAVLAISSASRFYFVVTLGERVVADIRTAVFDHLVRLDPAFFDGARSGELVSRLTADTAQVKTAFSVSVSTALRNGVLLLGALFMLILTSPKLSALVIGAIPLVVLPLILSGRAVRRRSQDAQDRLADASAFAAEAVGSMRTVQAFGMESETSRRFSAAAEDAFGSARSSASSRARLTGAVIFLVSASIVGVLWLGAQDVLAGTMTGGRLSQFVLYAVVAASSLGQLSEVYGELAQAAGAAERLGELLATQATIVAPALPHLLPAKAARAIAFEHVSFSYATRTDRSLPDLSFEVAPGEQVALVGPSGAGKSTVLQLLLRFYDPQAGRILVDGVPLHDLAPEALRREIALVPQEPAIFAASVADNIRYGRPDANIDEVRRAAQQAAAHDFIAALPGGYDAEIGERGVTLSGGQRQRIAIARAILKDAPILLLDEATSALDSENERAVQRALAELMAGRTTLAIAHRLSTVRRADRILVMDEGRIVEQGTHAALVAQGGLYARLAALQFEMEAAHRGAAE